MTATSLKRESNTYWEVFKNRPFYRTPPVAASGMNYWPNQDRCYHLHALQINGLFRHDGIIDFVWSKSFTKNRENSNKNRTEVIPNHNINEIKVSFVFMHGLQKYLQSNNSSMFSLLMSPLIEQIRNILKYFLS